MGAVLSLFHFQPNSIPVPVINTELGWKNIEEQYAIARYILTHHKYLSSSFLHMLEDANVDSLIYNI